MSSWISSNFCLNAIDLLAFAIGLDNEREEVAGILVVGLLGVCRGAEVVLGGLVGRVAVTPIPRNLVQRQEDVGTDRLDVGATAHRSTSKVSEVDPVLCQSSLENGGEDFACLLLLNLRRRGVVLDL